MSYCTVGDHYHEGSERPLPVGPMKGHYVCQTCYEIEYFKGLAEEAAEKAYRRVQVRERLKKAFCQKCRTSWRLCVDPEEHKKEKTCEQLSKELRDATLTMVDSMGDFNDLKIPLPFIIPTPEIAADIVPTPLELPGVEL